jgi:hypothetical protein
MKNLGYYSNTQNDMINLFINYIINYLKNKKNRNDIVNDLIDILKYDIDDKKKYILEIIYNLSYDNNNHYLIYLYILNKIHNIPIIIYDIDMKILLIIDNKFIINKNDINLFIKTNNIIQIKLDIINIDMIPTHIYVIYNKI